MKPITRDQIVASFVNMSEADLRVMSFPGLHETLWDEREFLGWRDAHHPTKGYLVFWVGDDARGLMVRSAESSMPAGDPRCARSVTPNSPLRRSACSWRQRLARRALEATPWGPISAPIYPVRQ